MTSSGWQHIKTPDDLERALSRMLNKILTSDKPLEHAGKFSSLANSWIACRRLELDYVEVKQVHEELNELRQQIAASRNGPIISVEERKT